MWRQFGLVVLISVLTMGVAVHSDLAAASQGSQTVTVQIDGLTCGACVKDVKAALTKVAGVSALEIMVGKKWVFFSDYADVRAVVTYDPEKAGVESLIKAIEATSNPLSAYKARAFVRR